MAKLRWAPEVVEDMAHMPLRWAQRIYETAELIAVLPGMGRAREELGGKRAFPSGYYFIIYDVLEDGEIVYISALVDCRRGDRLI